MKNLLLAVMCIGVLAGCRSLTGADRFVGAWALSDDLDEYNGLYLHTMNKDGSLDITHYPPNSAGETKEPLGTWVYSDGVLVWNIGNGLKYISFHKYKDVYVTTNYAVPRTTILIAVDMSEGRPIIDY